MSLPTQNSWTNFLALELELGANALLEKRLINDVSGKIQYVAVSNIPNAPTSDLVWMVWKLHYDSNGFLDRYQLPDNGSGLIYSFDDIITYFS